MLWNTIQFTHLSSFSAFCHRWVKHSISSRDQSSKQGKFYSEPVCIILMSFQDTVTDQASENSAQIEVNFLSLLIFSGFIFLVSNRTHSNWQHFNLIISLQRQHPVLRQSAVISRGKLDHLQKDRLGRAPATRSQNKNKVILQISFLKMLIRSSILPQGQVKEAC